MRRASLIFFHPDYNRRPWILTSVCFAARGARNTRSSAGNTLIMNGLLHAIGFTSPPVGNYTLPRRSIALEDSTLTHFCQLINYKLLRMYMPDSLFRFSQAPDGLHIYDKLY